MTFPITLFGMKYDTTAALERTAVITPSVQPADDTNFSVNNVRKTFSDTVVISRMKLHYHPSLIHDSVATLGKQKLSIVFSILEALSRKSRHGTFEKHVVSAEIT
jgi:hypothetical protein